ncbi:hypothetical protein JCM6882_003244 [Rhodosporidiobolus microsporus]
MPPTAAPQQPFAVTLRQDLERFSMGRDKEEQIMDAFGQLAGGTQGFPARPSFAAPATSSTSPAVTVLRSQTPSTRPLPHPIDHHQSESYIRDHGPLPLSRLRPLAHPGVWDLNDPTQVNTICREIDHRKFTYVIVGAGAAGLALARRLTEDPENFVCVLEAGPLEVHSHAIEVPHMQPHRLWDTSLDWSYRSVPQPQLGGKSLSWHAGKVVGGSSALDSGAWTRPPKCDVNAWAELGNEGWDWEGLLPYYKRAETFHPPMPARNLDPRTAHDPIFAPRAHGHEGPVEVSYAPYLGEELEGFFDALREGGLKEIDLSAGASSGVGYCPSAISPETQTRCTAESAYLAPIADRPNLMLITNALATGILFASPHSHSTDPSLTSPLQATEVEFCLASDPRESFYARFTGEVILCAGTFGSPKVLELSGVGDKKRLRKAGVDCFIDLPGVGENLQDHPSVSLSFKLKAGLHSLDQLETDHAFADETGRLYSHLLGPLTQAVTPIVALLKPSNFLSPAEITDGTSFLHDTHPGAVGEKELEIEKELWGKRGAVEVQAQERYLGGSRFDRDAAYMGITMAVQHPLSRGSVHITASDPLADFKVNTRLLSHPLDAHLLALSARHLHSVCTDPTGAMAEYVDVEAAKRESDAPKQPFAEAWEVWAKEQCSTSNHPTSTCSMLPLEDGGVVDPSLKVYGTSNVRVADLSVVPLAASGPSLATAYMIGEKASDYVIDAAVKRRKNY